jgi:hypothetical protein
MMPAGTRSCGLRPIRLTSVPARRHKPHVCWSHPSCTAWTHDKPLDVIEFCQKFLIRSTRLGSLR